MLNPTRLSRGGKAPHPETQHLRLLARTEWGVEDEGCAFDLPTTHRRQASMSRLGKIVYRL